MLVKNAGLWIQTDPHVKVGGVWTEVQTGYVKVAGSWRPFYQRPAQGDLDVFETNDIFDLLEDPTGYTYDPVDGWSKTIRDINVSEDVKFTPDFLARIRKIEVTFNAYSDQPDGAEGHTVIMADFNNEDYRDIGVFDWDVENQFGHTVYRDNNHETEGTLVAVVQETFFLTIPAETFIVQLRLKSFGSDGTPRSRQGFKNFKFHLGPLPEPPTINVVTQWPSDMDPYAIENRQIEQRNYCDWYMKSNGILNNTHSTANSIFSGNFLYDYGGNVNGESLLLPHLGYSSGGGLTRQIFSSDYWNYEANLINQGWANGYVNAMTTTKNEMKGIYSDNGLYSNGPAPEFNVGSPEEADLINKDITDLNGTLVLAKSKSPFMVETGFTWSADAPDNGIFIDNLGLPGQIRMRIGTTHNNLLFTGPMDMFIGLVSRDAGYGSTAQDILSSQIKLGILYRDNVASLFVNGVVIFEVATLFDTELYLYAVFEFHTLGNNGTQYLGISGMQQALVEGAITRPFENIKVLCTTAEFRGSQSGSYEVIQGGQHGVRTWIEPGFSTVTTDYPMGVFDIDFSSTVFYCANDSTCVNNLENRGIKGTIDWDSNFDNELAVARLLPPV